MSKMTKLSPLTLLLVGLLGLTVGLLTQSLRSGTGYAPFSPPVSLAASLVVLGAVLVVLAVRLKRAIEHRDGERVNPFHAVRLLAAARAAQFAGALFFGFGIGLILMVLGRTVPVAADVWLPMAASSVAALLLVGAGMYAEHACQIPPEDTDGEGETAPEAEPDVA